MTKSNDAPAVLIDVTDAIMTITLNRPDHGNAWNGAMAQGYFSALDDAARSPEVRAIVITGAGTAFCVGGDGEKLEGVAETGDLKPAAEQPYWFTLRVGKPIIAAINGACFGIGLQQVLCCDVRFASENAKFSTAYARRGLAAEMGMSWLLPRLVGTGHSMDLLLSARLVRSVEAEHMGLVNRLVAADHLLDEATAYARELVERCSPRSMHAIKQEVFADLTRPFLTGFARSETLLAEMVVADDFKEGMRSWVERRPPQFQALPAELALIDVTP